MKFETTLRASQIDPTAFVAANATVVGDVTVGAESSLWFGVVARGDVEAIRIGRQSNIQDNSVLHGDPGEPCIIGDRVTVGHAAIVHGATVGDDVLVGMRAVILNGAEIGSGSLIAAGAIVTEGTIVPPGSLVLGVPAKIRGPVQPTHQEMIRHGAEHYVQAAAAYRIDGSWKPPVSK
ncbi:MAG: gamma carbonic anhydrase family protein [Planctomycetota bacterium]